MSTNDIIPQDVVEAIWQEVGALPEAKALSEMNRLSKAHPALLAFVMARTQGLSAAAQEIGVYMLLVIFRMFESHFDSLKTLDVKTVEKVESRADVSETAQPRVMDYVSECLGEDDEDGDDEDDEDEDFNLTEDDQEALFHTMKVVVDAFSLSAAHA